MEVTGIFNLYSYFLKSLLLIMSMIIFLTNGFKPSNHLHLIKSSKTNHLVRIQTVLSVQTHGTWYHYHDTAFNILSEYGSFPFLEKSFYFRWYIKLYYHIIHHHFSFIYLSYFQSLSEECQFHPKIINKKPIFLSDFGHKIMKPGPQSMLFKFFLYCWPQDEGYERQDTRMKIRWVCYFETDRKIFYDFSYLHLNFPNCGS